MKTAHEVSNSFADLLQSISVESLSWVESRHWEPRHIGFYLANQSACRSNIWSSPPYMKPNKRQKLDQVGTWVACRKDDPNPIAWGRAQMLPSKVSTAFLFLCGKQDSLSELQEICGPALISAIFLALDVESIRVVSQPTWDLAWATDQTRHMVSPVALCAYAPGWQRIDAPEIRRVVWQELEETQTFWKRLAYLRMRRQKLQHQLSLPRERAKKRRPARFWPFSLLSRRRK